MFSLISEFVYYVLQTVDEPFVSSFVLGSLLGINENTRLNEILFVPRVFLFLVSLFGLRWLGMQNRK